MRGVRRTLTALLLLAGLLLAASLIAILTTIGIVASLLFILSLAGLSKHETSKSGLTYGIVGMGIALVATIALVIDKVLKPELDLTWLPVLLMAGASKSRGNQGVNDEGNGIEL